MVQRNLTIPHRIFCITDNPCGIDSDVTTVRLWPNPVPQYGSMHRPNCFVRLKAFSKDFAAIVGPRFVSIDLDCVITGNMDSLFDHKEDFKIWGDTNHLTPYNGSMWQMNTGARSKVWESFDPLTSPDIPAQKQYFGSDQAWISYKLGPDEKKWGKADGVYSYRNDIKPDGNRLPWDSKIVFFHGQHNQWDTEMQNFQWIKEHYK